MAAMVRYLPMLVVFKQVLTGLSRYFLTQLTRVYRVEADGILLVGSWCLDISIIAFPPHPVYRFFCSSVPPDYLSMRFYALVGSYCKCWIFLSLLSCQILDTSSSIHWLRLGHYILCTRGYLLQPRARYFYYCFLTKSWISLLPMISSSQLFIHENLCTRW